MEPDLLFILVLAWTIVIHYYQDIQIILGRLQLIKNAAARLLTGIDKRDYITLVLASLLWLPIKSRIVFKILLLTYKVLRGQVPILSGGANSTIPTQKTASLSECCFFCASQNL